MRFDRTLCAIALAATFLPSGKCLPQAHVNPATKRDSESRVSPAMMSELALRCRQIGEDLAKADGRGSKRLGIMRSNSMTAGVMLSVHLVMVDPKPLSGGVDPLDALKNADHKWGRCMVEQFIAGYSLGQLLAQPEPAEDTHLDNLTQTLSAVSRYASTHGDTFPSIPHPDGLIDVVRFYLSDKSVLYVDATGKLYLWNTYLSGKKASTYWGKHEFVACYEPDSGADGLRGVAFTDGTSRRVTRQAWSIMSSKSHIK